MCGKKYYYQYTYECPKCNNRTTSILYLNLRDLSGRTGYIVCKKCEKQYHYNIIIF
uniref:TFIIS-type domain-containing protein n=1 Tax=viral metagenome TaxID=1070528 RepID=A0A6C0E743_9ZZZZ